MRRALCPGLPDLSQAYTHLTEISSGASLLKGGRQNHDSTSYTFSGSQVQSIFGQNHVEISFYLKSAHNFAERHSLPQLNDRMVLDVKAGTRKDSSPASNPGPAGHSAI